MTFKWLCTLGILLMAGLVSAQQRWLTAADRGLQTDGVFTEFPLPKDGEAFFYLRTPTDVLKAAESIDQLDTGKDELSPLWNTMQQLLTLVFKADEKARQQ